MEKIAIEASEKALLGVREDLKHISDASLYIINARVDSIFPDTARSTGFYFAALDEYGEIKDSILHKEYTTYLLAEMLHRLEAWKSEKKLLIEKVHLDSYLSLLKNFDSPSSTKIKELLLSADEEVEGKKYFASLTPL